MPTTAHYNSWLYLCLLVLPLPYTIWNSLCLLGLPMGTEATWGTAHAAYNSWQYLCLVKLPMPPGVAYSY